MQKDSFRVRIGIYMLEVFIRPSVSDSGLGDERDRVQVTPVFAIAAKPRTESDYFREQGFGHGRPVFTKQGARE